MHLSHQALYVSEFTELTSFGTICTLMRSMCQILKACHRVQMGCKLFVGEVCAHFRQSERVNAATSYQIHSGLERVS